MELNNEQIVKFNDFLMKKYIDQKRPPLELRDKIDINYSSSGQSFEIFSIRPHWKKKNEKVYSSIAKFTYVKARKIWKIYWMRASGKWELYEPKREVTSLSSGLKIIDKDQYGCFWG